MSFYSRNRGIDAKLLSDWCIGYDVENVLAVGRLNTGWGCVFYPNFHLEWLPLQDSSFSSLPPTLQPNLLSWLFP